MKADQTAQWRLLDLAALDQRAGQIAHRLKNLPERADRDAIAARARELNNQLIGTRTAYDDLQREVGKAEADVQLVRDRAARNQARLDAGQGSAKDMQALQHELTSLARRQAELEDIQLEVMERSESLSSEVDMLTAKAADYERELAAANTALAAAEATLADEQASIERQRADVVPGVGTELVALYEKIRAQTGVGAAALAARRCEGCRLELMGADLERIRKAAADEVVRCEECRRILVRTAESGI